MRFCIVLACLVASAIAAPNSWRIIGGTEAAEGQFPYQISLRYYGDHSCGGSILNENTILTAAHCVHETPASVLTVFIGNNNLEEQTEEYQVRKVIVHQNYDAWQQFNDIAILKVKGPIKFRAGAVEPVKLRQSDIGEETVTLTGWGSTDYPSEDIPDQLQFIKLKTIPVEECKAKHELTVLDTNVCTLTKVGEGSCHRDSGGPLVDENKEQIGIVSWGTPCAVGDPDVFTRVYSYLKWINDNSK